MKYRHIKKWILLAGIVLSAVASHFSGTINSYYLQIVIFIGINIILAVSLNLINGYTGQFSLGHAGFVAVGAYTAASITTFSGPSFLAAFGGAKETIGVPVLFSLALVSGGIVSAIAGCAVGVPSLRLK